MTGIRISTVIEIPQRRIADMMIGAIEQNSMTTSWCNGVYLAGHWEAFRQRGQLSSKIWYDSPEIYDAFFLIEVHEIIDESEEPAGDNIKKHAVTYTDLIAGLTIMAQKYPDHFHDLFRENDDNITQDVFLQCITLKDVIYG